MPRHPPCALNNEHTNHPHHKNAGGHTSELDKKLIKEKRNHTNTHKQTTKAIHPCVFNARVHYTVLTQHPNHTLPTRAVSASLMVRHKKGDNAPDTQQCTNIQTTITFHCAWTTCVTKRHSNTRSCLLSVCFTRTIFNSKKAGSMTLAYSTNHRVQLHPKNKSSLERR